MESNWKANHEAKRSILCRQYRPLNQPIRRTQYPRDTGTEGVFMCVCVTLALALYLSSFPSFQEQQDKGDQNDGKKWVFVGPYTWDSS